MSQSPLIGFLANFYFPSLVLLELHFTKPAWLRAADLKLVSNGQNAVVKNFYYTLHYW